jgi:RecA/RadA recombinase
MSKKMVVTAVALVVVFLLGFVPQYVKVNRLENQLLESQKEHAGADLRDLIGLAYFQANQKNYGLAAETSNRFFARVRESAIQARDATGRKALEDLLVVRDRVTAALAKGDAAVMGDLQELFVKTRQVTASSGKP